MYGYFKRQTDEISRMNTWTEKKKNWGWWWYQVCLEESPKVSQKKSERIGYQVKNRDYLDHSIIKIGKNIQMSSGDLRKLAVT